MKYLYKSTIILLLLTLFSCEKDKFSSTTTTEVPNPTIIMERTSLVVYVEDNWGTQPRAFITINGESHQTDENGRAFIKLNGTKKEGDLVTITADNRIPLTKRILLQPGNKNIQHVYLEKINKRTGFTTEEEARLSTGGASVLIPANALVYKDGSGIYTGNYNINSRYLSPEEIKLNRKTPGGLTAFKNDQLSLLQSFGMLKIELIASDGSALDIASGKTATISFQIIKEMEDLAPDNIPGFWLNESTGFWIEEGNAVKVEGSLPGQVFYNYQLEVSHFTWWACQLYKCIEDVVTVTGRLIHENGSACGGCEIEIIGQEASITRTTNSDGSFGVLSCPNESYELIGYYRGINCDDNDGYSLGNFNSEDVDTDLGDIIIDDPDIISLSGTVFGCEAGITEEGSYVVVNDDHIIETFGDGEFGFLACYISGSTLNLEGFNEAGTLMSETLAVLLEPTGHSDLELSTCLDSDVYLDVYRDGNLIQHIGRPAQDGICNEDKRICIALGKEYFDDEYFTSVMEFEGNINLQQVIQYTDVEVTPQSSVLYSEDAHNNINNLSGKLSTIDILEVKEYGTYKTVYLKFTALAGSPTLELNYEIEFRIKL